MIDQFCFENKMKNLTWFFCPLKYNLKIYMTRQKEIVTIIFLPVILLHVPASDYRLLQKLSNCVFHLKTSKTLFTLKFIRSLRNFLKIKVSQPD